MGLLETDKQIFDIFDEACNIMLPSQLRKYFAWLILSENIVGDKILKKYKEFFIEDFKENKENNALIEINNIFMTEDMCCVNFGLPEPIQNINKEIYEVDENFILYSKTKYGSMYNELNEAQLNIFEDIILDVNKIYFIDGPGGSGKTFLYKTLIYYFSSVKKKYCRWLGQE